MGFQTGTERRKEVNRLSPSDVAAEWHRIAPLVNKVFKRLDTGQRLEDVLVYGERGANQIWKIGDWNAACVTEILERGDKKILFALYLGGEGMTEWVSDLVESLEVFAREHGCQYIECGGRAGWDKVSKRYGFEEAFRIMRKRL